MIRILLLWTKTVLDRRSGAAIGLKSVLEAAASGGCDCHTVSMTLFDGHEEFPLEQLIGPKHADPRHNGKVLEAEHRGVVHHLYRTVSTLGGNLTRDEAGRFVAAARRVLQSVQPDIVLTTGSSELARALHLMAAEFPAVRVLYFGNPGNEPIDLFAGFDHVWMPSRAIADYHRDRIGIEAEVFPTVLSPGSYRDPASSVGADCGYRRFVTLVNPSPEKGATLLLALARLAARERPGIRFLAVEARASREWWREHGLDWDELPNLLWVRNRRDMRPVYRRTAVLLFPSFWFEPSGRVPVEAQLSGIPVLATNRGGIPGQLNGGGFLFEAPARCIEDHGAVPTEDEVRPWLERIVSLLDDDEVYAEASRAARAAAEPFHPRNRHPEVVRTFERLLEK